MSKKYEFTDETTSFNDGTCVHQLHRIRALLDFGDVKAGDLGGFIQGEHNLDHSGNSWIYDDACVSGAALVQGDASVSGKATVCHEAIVDNQASISGFSSIGDRARVFGNADVSGYAFVAGTAVVFDDAVVQDLAHVRDNARVYQSARVSNRAIVCDSAIASGQSHIFGHAMLGDSARVSGQVSIGGSTKVLGEVELFGDETHFHNEVLTDPAKPYIPDPTIDILDVAFAIKGAVQHPRYSDARDVVATEGEVEFLDYLSTSAVLLEDLSKTFPDGAFEHVVFAYEVAEPFGHALVDAMLDEKTFPDPKKIALQLMREVSQCDGQEADQASLSDPLASTAQPANANPSPGA
jgi:carbonic anhydrase/acetyltransferase-like protein (isoleucine patch superfamily)